MTTRGTWVRTTHLLLGLAILLFVLAYGVSAVQMSHWSLRWTVDRDEMLSVSLSGTVTPRDVARALMREHGLQGELTEIVERDGLMTFRLMWPSRRHEVSYEPGAPAAHVTTSSAGPLGLINALHHLDGVAHESWLLNAWGVLVGLVSTSLIGVGITGVWLTFRRQDERLVGGVLFAVGLLTGVGLIVAMRML